MNITAMPATYSEAEAFFDRYEAAHVAPSPAGQRLMDATIQVFQSRLPAPLRPLAKYIISTMLDDDRLTGALGLPRATRATQGALKTGIALRNSVHRRRPLTTVPRLIPGTAGSTVYPDGYSLDQLGPDNVARPAANDKRP